MPLELTEMITGAGALGTASFGLVEAMKGTRLGLAGLDVVRMRLALGAGQPGRKVLGRAYGGALDTYLHGTYRLGSPKMAMVLRNGFRLGLSGVASDDLRVFATWLGYDADAIHLLLTAHEARRREQDEPEEQRKDGGGPGDVGDGSGGTSRPSDHAKLRNRAELARLELLLDARIEAALAEADDRYASVMKAIAAGIALAAALVVGWGAGADMLTAAVVGLAAVPVAPVAKDLVSVVQRARDALGKRAA